MNLCEKTGYTICNRSGIPWDFFEYNFHVQNNLKQMCAKCPTKKNFYPSILNSVHMESIDKDKEQNPEDETEKHLLAWAQCDFIPMFAMRNKKVFEGCNFRPDFTWSLPDVNVILECHQNAHLGYNKQEEFYRMQELKGASMNAGFTNTIFIRFNPSLTGSTIQLKFATLLAVLMDVFGKKKEHETAAASIIYLFYPDSPNIWICGN